jgi:ABC-type multidrug transport system permease subunit
LNTVVYVAVGAWLFGVAVDVGNLPSALVLLVLAVASLTGLGLAGASTFTLLDVTSQGQNPVEWLVGIGATFLAGVYFPPGVLPLWLQGLGEWPPPSHARRAARLVPPLGAGAGPSPIR